MSDDLISRQQALDALCRVDEYNTRSIKAIINLPSAAPEQKWIPIENEPPKEKKAYWVCTNIGYQCECRWTNNVYGLRDSDKWGWSIFDIPQYTEVVAYMPLPEPWKGEDNGERREE